MLVPNYSSIEINYTRFQSGRQGTIYPPINLLKALKLDRKVNGNFLSSSHRMTKGKLSFGRFSAKGLIDTSL